MDLDTIENKISEIEDILESLKQFDYISKNLINKNGYVKNLKDEDLKVEFANNALKINDKTYEEFVQHIKLFFGDYMETLKKDIKKMNEKRPLGTSFTQDWKPLEIDKKDFWYGMIADVGFKPSYYTVSFKLEECKEKNGGTNGIIVDVPSIGPSSDGLPINFNDPNSVKNYSGHWFENNKIMLYLKAGPNSPWVGSCGKMLYRIKAWR